MIDLRKTYEQNNDYMGSRSLLKSVIDLRKAYEQNNDCMGSRSLLKSVLEELYPNNQREIAAILAIFDEGFCVDIAEMEGFYADSLYKLIYSPSLIDHYGINASDALMGLKSWYVFYHGKEFIVPSEEEILLIHGNAEEFEVIDSGTNGEIEIVKFLGFDTEIMTIPNIIDGKRVIALGDKAFFGCRYVKKIIISEGIQIIGNSCFADCLSLESIQLPQSLKAIPDHAFSNCHSLDEVIMGNQITKIGNNAFEYCKILKNLILPDSAKVIGDYAFICCGNLTKITMGNEVVKIGNSALENCSNLSEVRIGNQTIEIGKRAFSSCKKLNHITIPSSVKKIGERAFFGSGIKTITLNEGLQKIGEYAFDNCKNLTKIEFLHIAFPNGHFCGRKRPRCGASSATARGLLL